MNPVTITKSISLAFVLTINLLIFNSCSKKVYFPISNVVPAARGSVEIKKDKNKNYSIDINVSDLAEVDRLKGNKKAYVIWMKSDHENSKNIGQINSDTKMFSKKLSASFHTVSSVKPTRIFITAEEDGTIQYPGDFEVLAIEIK
ncbi:MAG: hypothetical protein ABI851_15695 [Saprospiraceae bacterium]